MLSLTASPFTCWTITPQYPTTPFWKLYLQAFRRKWTPKTFYWPGLSCGLYSCRGTSAHGHTYAHKVNKSCDLKTKQQTDKQKKPLVVSRDETQDLVHVGKCSSTEQHSPSLIFFMKQLCNNKSSWAVVPQTFSPSAQGAEASGALGVRG